jgi:hypothetical protein
LVVQEKLDCPVSETELSSFHGLKPPGQNLSLHRFSHFSLSHTRTTVRVTPRPPLVIPWFLHGILAFLGEINCPRTDVSVPQPMFLHLKLFLPNPRSLRPMDGFEITLVHYLHSCHRTIPYNISKFPWLNQSDS